MSRTTTQRALSPETAGSPASSALSKDSALAAEIKALVVAGKRDAARERFSGLVALQQRRAARIAYHYLRDVHDADEAVQDAFVKVFTHIAGYREELPFEVWFTASSSTGAWIFEKHGHAACAGSCRRWRRTKPRHANR